MITTAAAGTPPHRGCMGQRGWGQYGYMPTVFIFFILCYSAFMGKLTRIGWTRLDGLVAEIGSDGLLEMVCGRVTEDEDLTDISRSLEIPYSVQWRWLSDSGRMQDYENSLKARADREAHELLRIADGATDEEIQTAKLRVDARKWLAAKWDRDRYGESSKVQMDVRYQVDLAGALLEAEERRNRLRNVVVDNETGEVV